MKKIICFVLVLVLIFSLTACGKTVCPICGEKKVCSEHTYEILGVSQTAYICKDCWKQAEIQLNNAENLVNGLSDLLGE